MLFGTEETENTLHEKLGGYDNVTVAQELAVPTLEFLKYIDMIKATPKSGDWIDALVIGTDMLVSHCQKKKYNKRVSYQLFTHLLDLSHNRWAVKCGQRG